ncbi:MAG: archaemetzincin [Planctomycetota bacterium]
MSNPASPDSSDYVAPGSGRRSAWFLGLLAAALLFVPGACFLMNRSRLKDVPLAEGKAREEALREMIVKLRPLHLPIHKPGPHDWLANHAEPGQTFNEYLACEPVTLEGTRRVLYIQPLGKFTPTQRKIVTLSAAFMAIYFNTEVKVNEDLPLALVPAQHQRLSRGFGTQLRTGYVLDKLLKPRLPEDAAACIAFTAADLYPEDDWNFVFGQASLYQRVGVWSLARYGDPDASPADFRLCLLRTLKVATHETGHMFSMSHCILYECNMNGSNHLQESDQAPLALCPECQAKLCWATRADPLVQFRKLAEFCQDQGLKDEQASYEKSRQTLERR